MFKKIAIVSAIVVMTAMIAAMGVTTTTQQAHAVRQSASCGNGINVCPNVNACVGAGVAALASSVTQNLQGRC